MNQSVLLKCEDLVFGYGSSEKKATGLAAPFNFELSAGEVRQEYILENGLWLG